MRELMLIGRVYVCRCGPASGVREPGLAGGPGMCQTAASTWLSSCSRYGSSSLAPAAFILLLLQLLAGCTYPGSWRVRLSARVPAQPQHCESCCFLLRTRASCVEARHAACRSCQQNMRLCCTQPTLSQEPRERSLGSWCKAWAKPWLAIIPAVPSASNLAQRALR